MVGLDGVVGRLAVLTILVYAPASCNRVRLAASGMHSIGETHDCVIHLVLTSYWLWHCSSCEKREKMTEELKMAAVRIAPTCTVSKRCHDVE